MIYLDCAATSFPKAPGLAEAIGDFVARGAGNPGRSGHALALAAQGVVEDARRRLAALFRAPDPSRIVFALNATDALNTALWGLLSPGDRVLTSSVEHNSVVRPLTALAERGVAVERVPCAPDGSLDPEDLRRSLREGPTRLVALTHASNALGTLLPVAEAARLAHDEGALLLVDAAQTAGVLPLDVGALGIDLLAFPGHKGLLGPTGTGGLYVSPQVGLRPLRQGGTGTRSEEERHPEDLPEGLEAGTVNTVGIAGLGASLRYLEERGVDAIRAHEVVLTGRLLAGFREIRGVTVHGPADAARQVAAVSITAEGWEPVDLAAVLDSSFGICVRPGLHCAPWAHQTAGTYPAGTVRFSPGAFTTAEEIDAAVEAVRAIVG
ncbi:MAG: aminotransferase class V-fold PLP-dependent enzyme [Deltaproteobacteria bacterium]|nr:aminotransferase class V-fold PLP-dependent enzyme [Deltaproteobacteria bacterium]